jgi:Mn-dependent DtxR family transcriptional regulator
VGLSSGEIVEAAMVGRDGVLAEMLGVKRTSVTLHARTLQQAGMIKYSRGHIQITDVEAMQETVCECYGTVKSYYEALLGPETVRSFAAP